MGSMAKNGRNAEIHNVNRMRSMRCGVPPRDANVHSHEPKEANVLLPTVDSTESCGSGPVDRGGAMS